MAIKLLVYDKLKERALSVRAFSLQAGIAYNTALALKRDSSDGIDWSTLDKICALFECEPGDLIKRVKADGEE